MSIHLIREFRSHSQQNKPKNAHTQSHNKHKIDVLIMLDMK